MATLVAQKCEDDENYKKYKAKKFIKNGMQMVWHYLGIILPFACKIQKDDIWMTKSINHNYGTKSNVCGYSFEKHG